jgi:acetyl-CoA carboxylase biotin carboxylase subunit
MRRALHELTIDGIETSRAFHLRVMDDPEFQRGDISIQWLEQRLASLTAPDTDPATVRLAAIAAALVAHEERTAGRVTRPAGPADAVPSVRSGPTWADVARREGLRS